VFFQKDLQVKKGPNISKSEVRKKLVLLLSISQGCLGVRKHNRENIRDEPGNCERKKTRKIFLVTFPESQEMRTQIHMHKRILNNNFQK